MTSQEGIDDFAGGRAPYRINEMLLFL